MKEFKKLIGASVIAAADDTVYFSNGYAMSVATWETYINTFDLNSLKKSKLNYYVPSVNMEA